MIVLGSPDSKRFAALLELEDDTKEAMVEIELEGMTPGEAIRHLNDLKVDLLNSLEECLPCLGWEHGDLEELQREHELGNGYAELIIRARKAIALAKGDQQ